MAPETHDDKTTDATLEQLTESQTAFDWFDAVEDSGRDYERVRSFADFEKGQIAGFCLSSEIGNATGFLTAKITDAREIGQELQIQTADGRLMRVYADRAKPIVEYVDTTGESRNYSTARTGEMYVVTSDESDDTDELDRGEGVETDGGLEGPTRHDSMPECGGCGRETDTLSYETARGVWWHQCTECGHLKTMDDPDDTDELDRGRGIETDGGTDTYDNGERDTADLRRLSYVVTIDSDGREGPQIDRDSLPDVTAEPSAERADSLVCYFDGGETPNELITVNSKHLNDLEEWR